MVGGGGEHYQHYLQSPMVKFRKALCSAKKSHQRNVWVIRQAREYKSASEQVNV